MIYGQWALVLNLLTIAVLAILVANVFVSIVIWSVKNKIKNYTVSSRKSLLWLCVLLPWFIALSVTLLFSPLFQSSAIFSWLSNLVHWHHADVYYLLSWHSISLVLFIGFSIHIVLSRFSLVLRNRHQIGLLRALAVKKSDDVFIIDSPIPTAFTGGLTKPKCFISSGLTHQLPSEDVDVIIAHELAHVHYYDPFKKWLFSCFTAYFMPNIKQFLSSMMAISMEQAADTFFVKNQKQAQNVASTLVKFTKLASKYSIHTQYKNELFVHFCRYAIEKRVLHLLNDTHLKSFPIGITLFCIVILTFISTTSVDSIHHAIEALLNH